jgi:putative RNA 2'-phosphotransferase
MSKEKQDIHLSKFLSLVLRHQPETIGITLDENGWTDTEVLIEKLHQHGFVIDSDALKHVVATNSKKRFALTEAGDKIRANQGHSVEVELGYSPAIPPETLYHGTGHQSAASILATGLLKKERHHVHLSADLATAISVGQRHGKPIVFKVLARKMHDERFEFFKSDNGVWLTDHVPPGYLEGVDAGKY